jgi:hypothetical protein
MTTPLLTLPLRQKRDLLRTRQLARQCADLLGFETSDQICIAAAVFDLACQALQLAGQASVSFAIVEECLTIVCTPAVTARQCLGTENLRLSKRLPVGAAVVRDDLPWMLQQLVELAPLDVFDEMRKLNQELLRALLDLAACRANQREASEPNAA